MPKPLLGAFKQKQKTENTILSATKPPEQKQHVKQMDEMVLDRILRKKRSEKYVKMLSQLDAGGHATNYDQINEIVNTIKEEFPEIDISDGVLLGCVSKCYLGRPYEVHTLDLNLSILKHYRVGETMPGGLEKARGLACFGGYAFIEVYTNCCRAVSIDGTVSVIPA